jgi:hypothetical protein
LSPGVLLTIPAGSRGLLASGQTSVVAAAVHAAVFVAAIYALHTFMNVEGFTCSPTEITTCNQKNNNNFTRGACYRACGGISRPSRN